MGTWGSGNFDDDTAADLLAGLTGRLLKDVTSAMTGPALEIEPDEGWGVGVPCILEILALLKEQHWLGAKIPEPATIAAWREKYLAVWDRTIDGLDPSPEFKVARRKKLVATFDRIAMLADADAARRAGVAPPSKAKKKGRGKAR